MKNTLATREILTTDNDPFMGCTLWRLCATQPKYHIKTENPFAVFFTGDFNGGPMATTPEVTEIEELITNLGSSQLSPNQQMNPQEILLHGSRCN